MLVCFALLGSHRPGGRARACAGGREERAQAELAAHNQLVTQLTLLHHQVRSQNIVQPGYFVPRNVLADAYYTPVRCGPCASALQWVGLAGQSQVASSLPPSKVCSDALRRERVPLRGKGAPRACIPSAGSHQLTGAWSRACLAQRRLDGSKLRAQAVFGRAGRGGGADGGAAGGARALAAPAGRGAQCAGAQRGALPAPDARRQGARVCRGAAAWPQQGAGVVRPAGGGHPRGAGGGGWARVFCGPHRHEVKPERPGLFIFCPAAILQAQSSWCFCTAAGSQAQSGKQ